MLAVAIARLSLTSRKHKKRCTHTPKKKTENRARVCKTRLLETQHSSGTQRESGGTLSTVSYYFSFFISGSQAKTHLRADRLQVPGHVLPVLAPQPVHEPVSGECRVSLVEEHRREHVGQGSVLHGVRQQVLGHDEIQERLVRVHVGHQTLDLITSQDTARLGRGRLTRGQDDLSSARKGGG